MTTTLPVHTFGNATNPTLVLLHPGGALHTIWLPFIREWCKNYYLLVPDLMPLTSLSNLAIEVKNLIEASGQKKVWLVGSSLGANVALLTAAHFPHLVTGLVIDSAQCGGRPPTGLPTIISILKKASLFIPHRLIISFLLSQFKLYEVSDIQMIRAELLAIPKTTFLDHIQLHFEYDATPFLPNISAPTLIMAGEQDMLTKAGEPAKLQKNIPFSTVQMIAGAGHVTFLKQPIAFKKLVHNFFHQNTT